MRVRVFGCFSFSFIATRLKNEVYMRVRVLLSCVKLRVQLGVFTVFVSFIVSIVGTFCFG